MKEEEIGEKPRRGKQAGGKAGGEEGKWDPIPTKEVDETLLCGAANGDRIRVKKILHLSVVLRRGGTVVPLAVAV